MNTAQLIEVARDFAVDKADYSSKPKDGSSGWRPRFEEGGNMIMIRDAHALNYDLSVGSFSLTDHAWQQMDQKLGPTIFERGSYKSLPTDFLQAAMKKFPAETSRLLNRSLEAYPGTFIRTYQNTVRAFLSNRYGMIDNLYMLEKAEEAFELMGSIPTINRVEFTPDRLLVQCEFIGVDPHDEFAETHDGQKPYSLFVIIRNDEIGRGKLECLGGFKRGVCNNTAIYDSEASLSVMHIGEPVILADRFAAAIANGLKFGRELLERFLFSKSIAIPDISAAVRDLGEENKWDVEMLTTVMQGTEGQRNLYGLSNGLSYAAQRVEDPDKRFEMEKMAGSVLVDPASLFGRAAQLRQKEWISVLPAHRDL